jgi:hypothetical protein
VATITGDHLDIPELAELADTILRLKFAGNRNDADWELFRRTLREARDYPTVDDPVDFALRKVEAKHAPGKLLAYYLKVKKRAESASAKARDRLERKIERIKKRAIKGSTTHRQRDLEYVNLLGKAEKEKTLAHRPSVVGEIKRKLGKYKPPHEDHLTVPLRVLAWSIITHEAGGLAFNLHLGTAMNEKALSSKRGVASFIQERIRDQLVRSFGGEAPDFWFGVETAAKGKRIHVHGGIILPRVHDAVGIAEKALTRAGGAWAAPAGVAHQVKFASLYGPYNWASYVLKRMNTTKWLIDRRPVAASQGMSVRTQARWPTLRRELPSA